MRLNLEIWMLFSIKATAVTWAYAGLCWYFQPLLKDWNTPKRLEQWRICKVTSKFVCGHSEKVYLSVDKLASSW